MGKNVSYQTSGLPIILPGKVHGDHVKFWFLISDFERMNNSGALSVGFRSNYVCCAVVDFAQLEESRQSKGNAPGPGVVAGAVDVSAISMYAIINVSTPRSRY